jgi:hypothetical protein
LAFIWKATDGKVPVGGRQGGGTTMTRTKASRIAVLTVLLTGFATLTFGSGLVLKEARAQGKKEQLASLQSFNYPMAYIRHRDGLGFATEISSELDRKDASWRLVPGLADRSHVSFESVNYPNAFLRHQDGRLKLHDYEDADLFRNDATFKPVNGLAKGGWTSFESVNYPDHFIRHKDGELWVEKNDGSELFAKDATFKRVSSFYRP